MHTYVLIFVAALLLSFALTPLMMALSRKLKILDMPNARKSHEKPMPLLGGCGIYLSTVLVIMGFVLIFVEGLQSVILYAFIAGISGVTIMGLIDDIISLSARKRLVILFLLAALVMLGSLQFYFPTWVLNTNTLQTVLISVGVMFWVVALTNAVNLSDGLDGLAGSLSLVSALGYTAIFYMQGRTQLALPTALALCGAIAGFLPYNLSPAKIFMGDAGSMFIGFMLGILSIMSLSQQTVVFFIVPILLQIVPLLDMFMAVLRRFLLHKPIMQADKYHFHHILNRRFHNHRVVVLCLACFQAVFGVIAVLLARYQQYAIGWILLGVLGVLAIIFTLRKVAAIRREEAKGGSAGAEDMGQ